MEEYDEKIVNAAKESFREAIFNYMNNDWIFNHAINKKFKKNEKLKQIVLEKYLKNFRMELKKEEQISIVVDRKKVLDIYSCIQEAWVRENNHSSIGKNVSDIADTHNGIILTKMISIEIIFLWFNSLKVFIKIKNCNFIRNQIKINFNCYWVSFVYQRIQKLKQFYN